ncbi:MAG: 50S ribosomal protein L19 [Leptospiraceae bacterium]|nr:50S ribosomal protein L19 [Leptospiraceae bacterium]
MDQLLAKLFQSEITRTKNFGIGDTVKVHYKILESGKERIQVYEGVVISENNKMNDRSFTVRRVSYDVGVERVFPLFSPRIAKIELVRKGKVRRAKLYYLRERSGKTARIKELRGGQAIVQAERKKQAAEAKVVKTPEQTEQPA